MTRHPLEIALEQTARRYALFPVKSRGIVACSGGRDSLALLIALHHLGEEFDITFQVVCIDHGLRDVGAEVEAVRRICSLRGIPFEAVPVTVSVGRGSLQAAAREARLGALERVAKERKAEWVALGHTATDQTETMLFRVARGAGLRGIAGIRPRRGRWVRPLLGVSREETGAYLEACGIEWSDDPSNHDEGFARIRIRNRWLPELEDMFPGATRRVAQSALRLYELNRWVEQEAGKALSSMTRERNRNGMVCDLETWSTFPVPLKAIALQRAMEQISGLEQAAYHLDSVVELATREKGTGQLDLPGLRVEREYTVLRLERARTGSEDEPAEVRFRPWEEIPGPGCYDIGTGFLLVERVRRHDFQGEYSANEAVFDEDGLPGSLGIRSIRPGERIRPYGLGGSKKISDVFIDRKIPAGQRSHIRVLTSGESVLWLIGVVRSDHAPVTDGSENLILVRCIDKT